jgi:hypothetical protein
MSDLSNAPCRTGFFPNWFPKTPGFSVHCNDSKNIY